MYKDRREFIPTYAMLTSFCHNHANDIGSCGGALVCSNSPWTMLLCTPHPLSLFNLHVLSIYILECAATQTLF